MMCAHVLAVPPTTTPLSRVGDPDPAGRFLSYEACLALLQRATRMARGSGSVLISLDSRWTGNLRWANNRIVSSGDVRDVQFTLGRAMNGAGGAVTGNQIDDAPLRAAVRRAELLMLREIEIPDLATMDDLPPLEPALTPAIWFDATFALDGRARAAAMEHLVASSRARGFRAAGYLEVSAHGAAVMDSRRTTSRYYPYTQAQYSVTVRTPDGSASGWAGVDWNDWSRVDAVALSQIALDKCERSQSRVRVEPGRYTAILEPQAVCDLCTALFTPKSLDREWAELGDPRNPKSSVYYEEQQVSPFGGRNGQSKIGERVIDGRLTVSTDPMDPDLGFLPFGMDGTAFHPATWIQDGVLTRLAYFRPYAVRRLGETMGLPARGAFKITAHGPGTSVSIEEMIAATPRGILVTRLSDVTLIDRTSVLQSGYTRDGTWLIQQGKIAHAIENFRFTESPMFVLNKVEHIGTPRRVFHPDAPVVVPALMVRDFNFTALSDAV